MTTEIKKEEGKTFITIAGRLDTVNAEKFMNEINTLEDERFKGETVIDCSGLEYISSSGLRAFISILKQTNKASGKLRVENLEPRVKAVFDLTGFSAMFGL